MFSRFFINRPIFATVVSLFIVLAGALSLRVLPIAEFPDIVPPEVQVSARYPGASAETIAQTVAAPLEQKINGVDNMLYMRSVSAGDGSLTITVSFEVGTDPDQNTINVNNRVQAAESSLPEEVRRQGVTVSKKSSSMLMVLAMESGDGRYDAVDVSNYALVNVIDELKRIPGVGDAMVFGSRDYSIRIWLRPDKLAAMGLTPSDVAAAVGEQNAQFAAGSIGSEPLDAPVEMTYTVTTQGRMVDPEQFADIILRANEDGSFLRLRDVAEVELGAQSYNMVSKRDGKAAAAMGVYLAPGANALETADRVIAAMERLSAQFPDGIGYSVPYNTTTFVRISVQEVQQTLIEAFLLVSLIIFIFLHNWRATLIPLLAVPVSIIGTFAGMYALGFSINTLTLFGLVLAIGIVVDDAIVVIENVERVMKTEFLPPKEATIKAMGEVSGAVVAIVLVLCSVFIPVAFMGGLSGEMYRQFAVTIAVSVIISGIVALTLTPALCALLLKNEHRQPILPLLLFERFFTRLTAGYTAGVRLLLKRSLLAFALFAVLCVVSWRMFAALPHALVPEEDKGNILSVTMLPEGASLSRTEAAMDALAGTMLKAPGVDGIMTLTGLDLLSGAMKTNTGTAFVTLAPWDERKKGPTVDQVIGMTFGAGASITDAFVLAFNLPPIMGMSNTGGVEGYVQDRGGNSLTELAARVNELVAKARTRPELGSVQAMFSVNAPQINVVLDRDRARAMGVPIDRVFETMQATFGAYYINDFNRMGRTFKVQLQSRGEFRDNPDDLADVYVRSDTGRMIPLTVLATVERTTGPEVVERFNVFPAAKVMASPAPGYSSGQAMDALEEVTRAELPETYHLAWTGSAYQERATGGTSLTVLLLGLLMVFLILAAQYERWTLPLAVILVVPFALFGAAGATLLRGLSNDTYLQIALVTLVGLASKNAILIVEFAVQQHKSGMGIAEAAAKAAELRFRPIVMTSLAFILGCLPLAISSGAGAASRHAIGTGVIGGMLAATFIAPFFIPTFYKTIIGLTERLRRRPKGDG
ncbi:efflux RND transporter permease subunit [Desulfocurvus vexinensis]|uniref:efflux RND transporter permease subunit n=1 Tax=Desulfocurvus vexinensis TaxID=399548 RepID=UPI00048D88B2|nr:multidrug efflux RND transporter permease subunit [Desulfocurvus vexinensis]